MATSPQPKNDIALSYMSELKDLEKKSGDVRQRIVNDAAQFQELEQELKWKKRKLNIRKMEMHEFVSFVKLHFEEWYSPCLYRKLRGKLWLNDSRSQSLGSTKRRS